MHSHTITGLEDVSVAASVLHTDKIPLPPGVPGFYERPNIHSKNFLLRKGESRSGIGFVEGVAPRHQYPGADSTLQPGLAVGETTILKGLLELRRDS